MSEKKLAENAMSSTMVEVRVRLYEPFYNFMKEYLAFFGEKKTVEELCRTMIYNDVNNLYRELQEFLLATFSKVYIEKEAS